VDRKQTATVLGIHGKKTMADQTETGKKALRTHGHERERKKKRRSAEKTRETPYCPQKNRKRSNAEGRM